MYEEVRRMRLEGIIAKRADSKYRSGRTGDWLKIRADRTDDFVIVGYSSAQGNRSGFGSLHLGIHDGDQLVYAGRVGSGFSDRQLDELGAQLDTEQRDDPPFVGNGPEGDKHTWVHPTLVAEVRYKEVTGAGQLRQPVFLRLRDDKAVEDCVRFDEPRQAIGEGGGHGRRAARENRGRESKLCG